MYVVVDFFESQQYWFASRHPALVSDIVTRRYSRLSPGLAADFYAYALRALSENYLKRL